MTKLSQFEPALDVLFSERWQSLFAPGVLQPLKMPGVYLLAYSSRDLAVQRVEASDVYYVGMSNDAKGVGRRLQRFADGVRWTGKHYGARKHRKWKGRPHSEADPEQFYFAAVTLDCLAKKTLAKPSDWQTMGCVAALEYFAIARVLEQTSRVPELNCKKPYASPLPLVPQPLQV